MFGSYAEDGELQRLLTRYNVPFVGADAWQSSVCLHKKMAKDQVRTFDIPTLKHFTLHKATVDNLVTTATAAAELFGPDFYVKPLRGALGDGVFACTGITELAQTLEKLFKVYDEVIVEERKSGRVVTCGVAENLRGQSLYTTPVTELVDENTSDVVVPARISRAARDKVSAMTKHIHAGLGLRHFSESDFIVDDKENIFYLESNSLPSLHNNSSYAAGLEAFGVTPEEFLTNLLVQAGV